MSTQEVRKFAGCVKTKSTPKRFNRERKQLCTQAARLPAPGDGGVWHPSQGGSPYDTNQRKRVARKMAPVPSEVGVKRVRRLHRMDTRSHQAEEHSDDDSSPCDESEESKVATTTIPTQPPGLELREESWSELCTLGDPFAPGAVDSITELLAKMREKRLRDVAPPPPPDSPYALPSPALIPTDFNVLRSHVMTRLTV